MVTTKVFLINGSLDQITPYLVDLSEYAKIHPLISHAVRIPPLDQSHFKVFEKPYSFLPIKISYSAEILASANEITYDISGLPFETVFINYTFSEKAKNATEINFKITIESILAGKKILSGKMISAQEELMKNLNKLLT